MKKLIAYLFVASVLLLSSCGSQQVNTGNNVSTNSSIQLNQPKASSITNFWPLPGSSGSVQTDTGIWFVDSNKGDWIALTLPKSFSLDNMAGVTMIDNQNVWIVSNDTTNAKNAWDYSIFYTSDGGLSWNNSSLMPYLADWMPEPNPSVSIQFINNLTGWVAIQSLTSSNFSQGELFKTVDGGKTWEKEMIPSGGEYFEFINENMGWTLNTPEQAIYMTIDGGKSWFTPNIAKSNPNDYRIRYNLPVFYGNTGYLYANVTGSSESFIDIYMSQDSGANWKKISSLTTSVSSVLFSDAYWLAFLGDATVLFSNDEGASWQERTLNMNSIPFTQVKYAAKRKIWGTVQSQTCVQPKKDCTQRSDVYESLDGGFSWTPIALYDSTSEQAK